MMFCVLRTSVNTNTFLFATLHNHCCGSNQRSLYGLMVLMNTYEFSFQNIKYGILTWKKG